MEIQNYNSRYRYTIIFIIVFLISLIIHVGGSLELAMLSYRAMKNALEQMLQTPEEAAQKKAAEEKKKEEEKASEKWIVSKRKYGSESGFIWVEDDTLMLPDKIPAQQAPPIAQPAQNPQESAAQKAAQEHPTPQENLTSTKEALPALQDDSTTSDSTQIQTPEKINPEQSDQKFELAEESRVQSLQPTMIGQSGRKRTQEEILQTLLKHKIPAQPQTESKPRPRARDQKSSSSGLSVQMLQREFSAFTAQRQKQEAMMLVPKGNDSFSSTSMYVEELPPEQQIRMDSYMRRMVWTMDNINKSLPMLKAPEEQGLQKLIVLISLQLDKKGNVINLKLKKGCGYKEFDERALFVFQEAKNFGDLPSFYTPETCTQHWAFSFIPQVVSQGYAQHHRH